MLGVGGTGANDEMTKKGKRDDGLRITDHHGRH